MARSPHMGLPASFEFLFLAFEFKFSPKDLIHSTRKFVDPFQIEKLNSIFLASPSDELPSDLQHGRPTDGAQGKQKRQEATTSNTSRHGTCSRLLSHQQSNNNSNSSKSSNSSFVVGTINGIVSDLVCPHYEGVPSPSLPPPIR